MSTPRQQPTSAPTTDGEKRLVAECELAHTLRKISARLTSWIALVTSMPRGQASVQLNVVRQRQTPSESFRISSRCSVPSSRLSKMNRCAPTIACGPKYWPSDQNTGQDVVQAAQRMHLVVSSKRSRSAGDWIRSRVGS